MEHRFKESTERPERFFSILPADWQEGITPYWSAYAHSARIFVIETATEVVGGGIVFSTPSPDCQPSYLTEAQGWFNEGYLYIGYLWISERHRDQQLGSKWLQQLFKRMPERNFWLSIEDYRLSTFYQRNGFQLIKQVGVEAYPEWVMAMEAQPKHLGQTMLEQVAV